MTRFALPIILALAAFGAVGPVCAEGVQTRPAIVVTVTCDDLTPAARAEQPQCGAVEDVQRPAAKVKIVPLFRPFQLADRSDRPHQRKLLRMPWVIGVYQ